VVVVPPSNTEMTCIGIPSSALSAARLVGRQNMAE
jgi:hypothetical protein